MDASAVSTMDVSPAEVSRHTSAGLDFSPPPPPQFIPQWIKLGFRGETPEDRCGTRVNCLLGALYITGADRAPGATFDVFAVNLETQECAKVRAAGVAPSPRDSHTSTVIGTDLVIAGGTDGAQKFNEIYFFNTMDKSWKMFPAEGNAMPARECHTSTAVGNKLYTFGGLGDRPAQEDLTSSYLADTWCFDMDSQTLVEVLTPAGEGPCARDSHAAAACGNSVIVTGGHGGERVGLLDDVWQLDTASDTWRQLRITSQWSPGGCAGHTAVSLGENAILVYGGLTKMRMEKDVWVLYVGPDPARNLKDGEAYWDMLQVTDSLPPGRYAHAADYSDGCFFITGGVSQNKHNLNDTWVLALTQDAATKMSTGSGGSGPLSVLKRGKRDEAAPKKITSYNIFCSETREQLRAAHPELSSRDIEKLMGQQWGEMAPDLKRAYEDRARQINAAAAAALAAGVASGQVTKKAKVDKPASQMVTSVQPPHAPATTFQLFTPNPSLIGAQVEGAIDAVFNAGYLATVKVNGFTYRALLFSPYLALSVPVSVQPPTQGTHRPSQ